MPTIDYTPTAGYFGVDSFTYRATNPDAAFDEAVVTVTVNDTEAPVVVVTAPTSNQQFAFGTPSVTISGTASDNDSVSLVEIRIDGGAWQTAAGTTSWSFTLGGVSDGQSYSADVRATDPAGNVSAIVTRDFSVLSDGTAPSIAISAPAPELPANTSAVTVAGTASDNSAVTLVQVRVDGGAWNTATGTTSWTYGLSGLVNGQSYLVEARATDDASNTSTVAQRTVTVNQPPTANSDVRTTSMNTQINIDVLSNDANIDAGATLSIVAQAANGTAVVVP